MGSTGYCDSLESVQLRSPTVGSQIDLTAPAATIMDLSPHSCQGPTSCELLPVTQHHGNNDAGPSYKAQNDFSTCLWLKDSPKIWPKFSYNFLQTESLPSFSSFLALSLSSVDLRSGVSLFPLLPSPPLFSYTDFPPINVLQFNPLLTAASCRIILTQTPRIYFYRF